MDDDATEAEERLDAVALRELCGRPWVAEFTEECLAVLERRYRDAVPDVSGSEHKFRPVMLGEPVTWAQVFADVAGALGAVREALGRAECLVPEGRFRLDLRDACAADDIARLAILRRECAVALYSYYSWESRQRWWDVELGGANYADDQFEYHRRLERLDDRWFGLMWRLGKCQALPEDALGKLGPFHRPLGARKFGMDDEIDMMEIAARLGSDWALSSVLRMGGTVLRTGEEGIDDVRERRPVLAELLRMRRAEGAELVMHALVAFMLGDALGVQVHGEGVRRWTRDVDAEQRMAGWPLAMRRMISLGWTVVVDDGQGGKPRRFERPEDVGGGEPWPEWWTSGWLGVESAAAER